MLMSFPQPLNALVIGASRGIGLGFVQALLRLPQSNLIYAACRRPEQATALHPLVRAHPQKLRLLALDVSREPDFAIAADTVQRETPQLHLLLNAAGVLHDGAGLKPERRIEELDPQGFLTNLAINALGPALAAKHFLPLLRHDQRAVFASLSARVGSIADNRLGGWYSYRAAKAAQNQFTRCFAIETSRRAPNLIVCALHPGTVNTDLSQPFSSDISADKLFTVERAVAQLMAVIDGLDRSRHGGFYAWDGSTIAW